ncbi:hypothetical protein [Actinoplanes italicus]|nr:hypothetical protein [Actinoplanes italicus]
MTAEPHKICRIDGQRGGGDGATCGDGDGDGAAVRPSTRAATA